MILSLFYWEFVLLSKNLNTVAINDVDRNMIKLSYMEKIIIIRGFDGCTDNFLCEYIKLKINCAVMDRYLNLEEE